MTLAETFLLLVFMFWYSIQPKIQEPPSPVETVMAENEKLKKRLAALEQQRADLDRRLEWWRTRFNQPVPGSEGELKRILFEAGRGKPKCQDDNLLLEVRLINGSTSVKVLSECQRLRDELLLKGIGFRVGAVFSAPSAVDSVLAAARDFRRGSGPDGECRFDYHFVYATNDDYYEGRERFEKYLYSAGRQRAAEAIR
jgi:hypothetical protein